MIIRYQEIQKETRRAYYITKDVETVLAGIDAPQSPSYSLAELMFMITLRNT